MVMHCFDNMGVRGLKLNHPNMEKARSPETLADMRASRAEVTMQDTKN
jgi:hypothetical protein